jgi:hypothetical protein
LLNLILRSRVVIHGKKIVGLRPENVLGIIKEKYASRLGRSIGSGL